MRSVYLQAVAIEEGIAPPDPRKVFPDQPRLARLDLPSRYVACAAGGLPIAAAGESDATAVILGTRSGSLDADLAFAASIAERPSPATYARTLPSTAGAELAILLHLRGPNFSFVLDGIPGLLALAAAVQEIRTGSSNMAVAGEYDAVSASGSPGSAVLCLLGTEPGIDGRSRPLVVSRLPAEGEGPNVGLRDLVEPFLGCRPDQPFLLEGTGSGSRIRVECGPAIARCL